jgi:CRISP-associated protein Cas1
MPLADDLMEPFRPVVDAVVVRLLADGYASVTPTAKYELAGLLHSEEVTEAGRTPLNTCVQRLAASVGESFVSGVPVLSLPKGCLE